MKKILSVLLCALLATSLLTACSSFAGVEDIRKRGTLVVLTNAEFPPYEYMGPNGEVVGIDHDIAQAVADELGVELDMQHMDFDGLLPALKGGKGDLVAAGMTVTDERKESVDFSDTYADAKQMIIVNKAEPKVVGEEDLAGKAIGVQLGTTGDLWVSENVPDAEVMQYKSGLEAAMDLKNGRLDAVVLDKLPSENIVENNADLALLDMASTDEQYAMAAGKGNRELLDVVNAVIKQLQDGGQIEAFTATHVEAAKNA